MTRLDLLSAALVNRKACPIRAFPRLTAVLCGAVLAIGLLPVTPAWAVEPDYLEIEQPPGSRGGRLVVALRSEPQTFNPVVATDNPTRTIVRRIMATLVGLDHETHESAAALARGWTVSKDGRRMVLELRRGLRFSDGHPFDIEDVLFTFRAHLDEKNASSLGNRLMGNGRPVIRKLDAHRLELYFDKAPAEGVGFINGIDILPRHLLEKAQKEGRLTEVWSTSTPPEEIAGLGPFRLRRYVPGERLVLERNPYYWKVDKDGQQLPYLDEVTFLFVPSPDAQVIRFEAGEIDLIERLTPESFQILEQGKGRGKAGKHLLRDLGPGLDFTFFFFNLNDVDPADLPEVARRQTWFRHQAFRRAMSVAIDREGIARVVFHRRATPILSHVTSGNRRFFDPDLEPPRYAPETARQILEDAGFFWDESGKLYDFRQRRVEFSIITNSNNQPRVDIATLIQEDLRRLGIEVKAVALEFGAMVERLTRTYDYDACILGLSGDVDPNAFMAVWPSNGANHLWRLHRTTKLEPWQSEIDRLMEQQVMTVDSNTRRDIYRRVQRLLAEHLPVLPVVSPNALVGVDRGLGNFQPSILDPHSHILWNVEELYWRDGQRHQR